MKLIGTTPEGEQIVIIAKPLSQRLNADALEKLGAFVGSLTVAPAECALAIPPKEEKPESRNQKAEKGSRKGAPAKKSAAKEHGPTGQCKICGDEFSKAGRGGYKKMTCDKPECISAWKAKLYRAKHATTKKVAKAKPHAATASVEDVLPFIRNVKLAQQGLTTVMAVEQARELWPTSHKAQWPKLSDEAIAKHYDQG